MRKLTTVLVLVALLVVLATPTMAAVPKKYLVMSSLTGAGVVSTTSSQIRIAGAQIERVIPRTGVVVASTTDSTFPTRMRAAGYIVGLNRQLTLPPDQHERVAAVPALDDGIPEGTNPFAAFQWNIDATNSDMAWFLGRDGGGMTVAVIDTGFYLNHPDVDDVFDVANGRSFVPGETLQFVLGPRGYFSHGTHVSGIIAAEDNDLGTIGLAPNATIVPIKVLSDLLGYGEDAWVLDGLAHAWSKGVDIVNMSLGGICDGLDPDCVAIKKIYDRVGRSMAAAGILIFASAGNSAIDFDAESTLIDLPAMAAGIYAISATGPIGWAVDPDAADPRDQTSYSNYGRRIVDFAGPGGSFDYPGEEDCTVAETTRPCWVFDMVFSPSYVRDGGIFFSWAAGTSMASPAVAAIAAQIWGFSPWWSPAEVIASMRVYVDKLNPAAYYGKGFVKGAANGLPSLG